ncbi:hypothetical protein GH714_022836 [Hevea brasiliensis]|uniref:Uncharacterized protein n=1 Tax=Hevea brasiliensis TaxID=3981 RepID=A0A6A6MCD4_HEVBR|nr:hypothetical protein GH714_022836 [Hevea brasiliensis]
MIDGEGPRDDVSGPASPDPFESFLPKLSGGGDVSPESLSRYSSCGGESEFERLGGRFDRNLEERKLSGSGFDLLKGSVKEGSQTMELVNWNCIVPKGIVGKVVESIMTWIVGKNLLMGEPVRGAPLVVELEMN